MTSPDTARKEAEAMALIQKTPRIPFTMIARQTGLTVADVVKIAQEAERTNRTQGAS